ncbi:MAG: transglutaminase domain-containing protein [Planctomycetota bacterium]
MIALLPPLLLASPVAHPSAPAAPAPAQSPEPATESGWERFVAAAAERHGDPGRRAAEFLLEHRPERDADLPAEWLLANLDLALEARGRFPWAKEVDEAMFLNDVLPYAILDEKRESWRRRIHDIAAPLVAECETATEAAQAINAKFFDVIGVHYNTGRKRPNACASESIEQGRATCTGLTILYVEACRSVGLPARAAGVFTWHDDRGNHTWPEVWDGKKWRFTGADEHDANGLDRAWFAADAARATPGDPRHAVWATSWRRTGSHFPLAWDREDRSVRAVEVTARYVGDEDDVEEALATLATAGAELGEEAAGRLAMELWNERKAALAAELEAEAEAGAFEVDGAQLRVKERVFGDAPERGHALWISMHGGGGAPPEVNDRQWNNQIRLYEPAEGIYVAPRAPTDTWNMWHQAHVDDLFDRMIASYVARRGVDPDRVYLLGYSAGGDGVYQLAPRMADRFGAASMMAGHPNETRPDGLRNLPFLLFMGGDDAAYKRNEIAAQWKDALAELRDADPGGYEHEVTIYPGKGHWMDGEDKSALPWMAERRRRVWPKKVVWLQDDVAHERFYWLAVSKGEADDRARVEAEVEGQEIAIASNDAARLTLHLHDRLVDLDRPFTVTWNGVVVHEGEVARTRAAIEASLASRADPRMCATALLSVARPDGESPPEKGR